MIRFAQPRTWVFAAIALLWFVIYWSFEPPNRGAPADAKPGSYYPMLARGDGHYMYLGTLSLILDRDFDMNNQYVAHGDPFGLGAERTPNGQPYMYPIGLSIVQSPFFVLAHAAAFVANLFGADVPMHGYSYFHQRIAFLGALLVGWLALVFAYRTARRRVSETAALYGVALIGLGTGLLFYSALWVSYAHAWTAFTVAWLIDRWDATRGRTDARRWAELGALVGLAALVRLNDVPFAVLPAAEWAVLAARTRDRRGVVRLVGLGLLATACALIVVSPQLLHNWRMMGSPFAVASYTAWYMRWDSPFMWEVLFSPHQGLFVWTPIAYFGAVGLAAAPRGARALAVGLAATFLIQVWINGASWDWWGGFGYSARRLLDATLPLTVGVAFGIEKLRAWHHRFPRVAPHALAALFFAPCVAMNVSQSWFMANFRLKPTPGVTSTALYTHSLDGLIGGAFSVTGNPMSWPHNLLWAARHGVSPARYDAIVGQDFLQGTNIRHYRVPGTHLNEKIAITDARLAVIGAGPWSKAKTEAGRTFAWAGSGARLLVPLMLYEDMSFIVRAEPPPTIGPVTFLVNGYAQELTPVVGVQEFRLAPPNGVVRPGTNELEIRCAPSAPPGCLAVESVTLVYEPQP